MNQGREVLPIDIGGRTVMAVVRVQGGEEDVASHALSFADFTQGLEAVASQLAVVVEKVKPDQASIEFGVSLALEGGKLVALLFDASATGSLSVTLTWGKGE
jgi:hypothetical protein